jgi:Mycolic acid cyclopropane synthetase
MASDEGFASSLGDVGRFLRVLDAKVKRGTLEVTLPGGRRYRFGTGEPNAQWTNHDPGALRRLLGHPELEMGETYVEGGWDAGRSGLSPLLRVLIDNLGELGAPYGFPRLAGWLRTLLPRRNGIGQSYRNVSRHYDLDEALFRSFLDDDLQYSCAYYAPSFIPSAGARPLRRSAAGSIGACSPRAICLLCPRSVAWSRRPVS